MCRPNLQLVTLACCCLGVHAVADSMQRRTDHLFSLPPPLVTIHHPSSFLPPPPRSTGQPFQPILKAYLPLGPWIGAHSGPFSSDCRRAHRFLERCHSSSFASSRLFTFVPSPIRLFSVNSPPNLACRPCPPSFWDGRYSPSVLIHFLWAPASTFAAATNACFLQKLPPPFMPPAPPSAEPTLPPAAGVRGLLRPQAPTTALRSAVNVTLLHHTRRFHTLHTSRRTPARFLACFSITLRAHIKHRPLCCDGHLPSSRLDVLWALYSSFYPVGDKIQHPYLAHPLLLPSSSSSSSI